MIKELTRWTGYADDQEIKDYKENYNDVADGEVITLERAADMLAEDQDYWSMQWESLTEYLTELMKGREYWRDDATRMSWQSRSGYKVFKATTGQEFIDAITPNTSDFSLVIYKYYNGFKICIGHHDAPMGEYHTIKAVTEKIYEDNQ